MSSIKIEGLEKFYGQTKALEPADLDVKEGEFIVFVGPSGCGKTTFLRLIAGLEEASAGQIFIGGKDVTWVEPKDRGVAMVFQNYALYPHMTVKENLEYPLNILKLDKVEKASRVEEVATLLEIKKLLNRKPAELSGGQKQRVAIGRALVRKPDVFLFDEPLSNLDARLRGQMRVEILALHQRLKRTTIYVTHDQHEAMTLADRLVVMKDGIIMGEGAPLELYNNPRSLFVAQFLGHPPLNLLTGRNSKGVFTSKGGVSLPAPMGAFFCGIRPEHISLNGKGEAPMKGKVAFIEHLGREAHVQVQIHVEEGKNPETMVIVTEDNKLQLQEEVSLYPDMSKVLWFDPLRLRVDHEVAEPTDKGSAFDKLKNTLGGIESTLMAMKAEKEKTKD
ncbi:MAG: ABC transporter ATP-binding protein [SAR324 cluster bacterium]|nr:ABC transporter ATP-binding protein [SAR324 cluster bacterium]